MNFNSYSAKIIDYLRWRKILKGIRSGYRAFTGPTVAQIDLTDYCNNSCLGCWVHSPLVKRSSVFPQGQKQLPLNIVKRLINQLSDSGVRKIILSGSGEPLLYPYIEEVVKIIKKKGIYLNLITNGLLLDSNFSRLAVNLNLDLITVSLWAGDQQTYIKTHPGIASDSFNRIKENLINLRRYQNRKHNFMPHLKLYNVICNLNANNIEKMVDFAVTVDADSIEFSGIDTIKGETDSLKLQDKDKQEIIQQFNRIKQRDDLLNFDTPRQMSLKEFSEGDFLDFGKIWKRNCSFFIPKKRFTYLQCKQGEYAKLSKHPQEFANSTNITTYRYKFRFDSCPHDCQLLEQCPVANDKVLSIDLLNFLGVENFLANTVFDSYQHRDVSSCYIGWYYCRVLTNGDIIPCCKGSDYPLGNLYHADFNRIWHSQAYQNFRQKAKSRQINKDYFSGMNCASSCDNYGMNLEIKKKIMHSRLKNIKATKKARRDYVTIKASDFNSGNLNCGNHRFGKGLVIDGGDKQADVEYYFKIEQEGVYYFYARYACNESRAANIFIDERLVKEKGLARVSGGWEQRHLKNFFEFKIKLSRGSHKLRISTNWLIPHLDCFILINDKVVDGKGKILKKILPTHFNPKSILNLVKPSDIFTKLRPARAKNRLLEILGIFGGQLAFKGPFHVQIDLTNDCNNNCIGCWCNSPLLKEKRSGRDYLPLLLVKDLIDELGRMRVSEIYYSGGGEPFMHPDIIEILRYTKSKNIRTHVNTNFTLVNKRDIDQLIDIGVDFLTISLWAATPEVYVATHPNKQKADFNRIIDNLSYLNQRKTGRPQVKLYNVIFNMNYHQLQQMVELAQATASESVEFALIDTMPGATDKLALTEREIVQLRQQAHQVKDKFINNCSAGNNVILFQFEQFLRRLSVSRDVQEARYDRNIINSMPCYIGWLFARITANGQLHSCLKAHRIPTGSLYESSFADIWNSQNQFYFRKKTLNCDKSDPFFRLIGNDSQTQEAGCYKSCDDIGRNRWMHQKISAFNKIEVFLFKAIAKILSKAKTKPLRRSFKEYNPDKVLAGIICGRQAFAGPREVVIDLTNRCNLRCRGCWIHSPLPEGKKYPLKEVINKELPLNSVKEVLDELEKLEVRRVRFTGGGEPFMHPQIEAILDYALAKKFKLGVTTNLTLANKRQIKKLMQAGLSELCVSLWAADTAGYLRTHQGCRRNTFSELEDKLRYLKENKQKTKVTFANVINNINYADLEKMYYFALNYQADSVYFTPVDIIPGVTDHLLLNPGQRQDLLKQARKLAGNSQGLELDFYKDFLRRIEGGSGGYYDRGSNQLTPCYAGWIFARILADGLVVPCCRAVKRPMGDINKRSFADIWFSDKYNRFRMQAKYLDKSSDCFKDIGCLKECDNLIHNQHIKKELRFYGG
jgi:MoaA/NifB/PqqE/SkfB family radical SAM enzyme